MTLYIGDKPVGLMKVVKDTKYIDKTKYGVSIDSLLGDVDENGVYTKSKEPIVLDLTGVKTVGLYGFSYRFYRSNVEVSIIAPDVISVLRYGFEQVAAGAAKITARFDSLEEITNGSAFDGAFSSGGAYTSPDIDAVFPRLKKIGAQYAFRDCFDSKYVDLDKTFPALEEIINSPLCFRGLKAGQTYTFSKLKKIVGESSKYSATFYVNAFGTISINLPSATELSGYVCYTASSYKCVLHFASANQAAIEACDGYSYMFGATEIYFDL